MARPRHDEYIVALIASGKLFVCPQHGRVWVRNGRRYQEVLGWDKDGYVRVRVRPKRGRPFKVELRRCRIVYVAVFGPTELEVDHWNLVRDDDRIENLSACTHQENMLRRQERRHYVEESTVDCEVPF